MMNSYRVKGCTPCGNLGWTTNKVLCHSILWFNIFCMLSQYENRNGKEGGQTNMSGLQRFVIIQACMGVHTHVIFSSSLVKCHNLLKLAKIPISK